MGRTSELERVLADAGGADVPREWFARLSDLLRAELERGARELRETRTGYPDPIVAALAAADGAVLAALPLPVELRADPDVVSERGGAVAAAAVEALVEASGPGPPASSADLRLQTGDLDGRLALRYPAAEPAEAAEYAKEVLDEAFARIDRLRARALVLPARRPRGHRRPA